MSEIATLDRKALRLAIERETNMSPSSAREALDQVLDVISDALGSGESVKISNFGVFRLIEKSARPGRSFRENAPVSISARRIVSFSGSKKLRDQMDC